MGHFHTENSSLTLTSNFYLPHQFSLRYVSKMRSEFVSYSSAASNLYAENGTLGRTDFLHRDDSKLYFAHDSLVNIPVLLFSKNTI